jgi:hypothetical protein
MGMTFWPCLQEKKRQEAAAKKAEAKKMAEEEAAQLASSSKKTPSKSAGTPKARHPQLWREKAVTLCLPCGCCLVSAGQEAPWSSLLAAAALLLFRVRSSFCVSWMSELEV